MLLPGGQRGLRPDRQRRPNGARGGVAGRVPAEVPAGASVPLLGLCHHWAPEPDPGQQVLLEGRRRAQDTGSKVAHRRTQDMSYCFPLMLQGLNRERAHLN